MSTENEHGFDVEQEEDHVAERALTRVGIVCIAVAVLAVVASTALLGRDQARLGGGPAERADKQGQVAPATIGLVEQTLIEHEARGVDQRRSEDARLRAYGWVDRSRGIAHIPIDKAMEWLLVEESAGDAGSGTAGRGTP